MLIVAIGGVICCVFSRASVARSVAITFDDLPYVFAGTGRTGAGDEAVRANARILKVLRRHHAPGVGFVIETRVQQTDAADGTRILRDWAQYGLELGNHTYSHADLNELSISQFEDEVVKGEATFLPLMNEFGHHKLFFRFPMNHTGDTKEKHEALSAFLTGRGYIPAPCTIDASDYLFNRAYTRALNLNDAAAAARIESEYLEYSAAEIDYYARLNEQVLGYEPPEIMLLHDNRLNSEVLEQILALFQARAYRFVTLEQAESDAAYQIPDTYITKYGPMWGYRWAAERGVKVDGRLEREVPAWVSAYAAATSDQPEDRY